VRRDVGLLLVGDHTASISCTDYAMNTGNSQFGFHVNSAASVISVDITYSPSTISNNSMVTYNATATGSSLSEIRIYVDDAFAKSCASTPCTYTAGPYFSGESHSYNATAIDASNNRVWTPMKTLFVATIIQIGGSAPGFSFSGIHAMIAAIVMISVWALGCARARGNGDG